MCGQHRGRMLPAVRVVLFALRSPCQHEDAVCKCEGSKQVHGVTFHGVRSCSMPLRMSTATTMMRMQAPMIFKAPMSPEPDAGAAEEHECS